MPSLNSVYATDLECIWITMLLLNSVEKAISQTYHNEIQLGFMNKWWKSLVLFPIYKL